MCTIKERTNSFAALSIELESSLLQLKNSLVRPTRLQYGKMMALESCQNQLETSLIELENSLINLRIIQIREISYLIWELFNWVGEFSNSIKELSMFILFLCLKLFYINRQL